jgi:beta-glucosidase
MSYKNPNLPIDQRVDNLLAQMTLEEKVAQLCSILPHLLMGAQLPDSEKMRIFLKNGLGRMTQFTMLFINQPEQIAEFANAIQKFALENTRLGIPVLFQNEALNGYLAVKAANFPTSIALASTWEPELVEAAAKVIRQQMRATGTHQALTPVIDLAQDPRWGRVHETFGEDTYLTSAFAEAFVRGLQGSDWKEGVISCAKHFLGYSISQGGLNMASIRIGERELYETFARPFEAAIKDCDLGAIMVTYSEIDGKPVSVSSEITRRLLREKMGFQGMLVSDGGSIELTVTKQHVAKDFKEAAILAIDAGLDANAPISQCYPHLVEAVRQRQVDIALIDEAARRVLTAKFRLGLFENPFVDVQKVAPAFNNPDHRALSRKLAERSITLLKNEGNLLPLKSVEKIAVIGPHADNARNSLFAGYTFPAMLEMTISRFGGNLATMQGVADAIPGDGNPQNQAEQRLTAQLFGRMPQLNVMDSFIRNEFECQSLLEAVQGRKDLHITYAQGCGLTTPVEGGVAEAVKAAEAAEVIILALGGKSGWGGDATCGEGRDSTSIELNAAQQDLLEAVHAVGKPVVLVLFDGRPLAIPWAEKHIPAILLAWFPGLEGASALADVIFGDVNPGGKLPVTLPRSVGQVPIFYNHKSGSGYKQPTPTGFTAILGEGYCNEDCHPLFPFGHGLSYTAFDFSELQLDPPTVDSAGAIEISCRVKNVGAASGGEVVQLYLHDVEARVTRPVMELAGFQRVDLAPGESRQVIFTVPMNLLGFYNHQMQFVVEPGKIEVMIGASSKDIRLAGSFEITGETKDVMRKRSYLSQVRVV